MRVVHVIDSGGYYGAEVMLVHLCQAQIELGLDVEVISIGTPGDYEKPLEKHLRKNAIPYKIWRMLALPDLRESLKILKHCKQTSTDVIHSHGYKGNILLGTLPKKIRKIPVVATMHGYTTKKSLRMALNQWLNQLCFDRLAAVILVSDGMLHQVPAKKLENKLHIIHNGIPEEIPSDANDPIPELKKDDFIIGALGRLSPEKNYQLLIRAIPLVQKTVPNVKLYIFGEGSEKPQLNSLIEALSLKKNVFLPGYINAPSKLYRNIDVFVNCSVTEGMPITLLEAMREGCPIVATDIPANRSLLRSLEISAKLVGFSEEELANAITSITSVNLAQAKEEQKSLFKSYFTSRSMAQKYLDVYQTVC